MFHVLVTFLLRSRGVSVTYLYAYVILLSYVRRIKAYMYVLCKCDVCMAYEAYAYKKYHRYASDTPLIRECVTELHV